MGIVNVTPDSFSDGGQFVVHGQAIRHAGALLAEGADILDIGGESTRPGAAPVNEQEEIRRVVPVIQGLVAQSRGRIISVDTYKANTARAALVAGAQIVNDVWGLQRDPAMADVVAAGAAGLVIMHNRHDRAEGDIFDEMARFFGRSLEIAAAAGIPKERIALDPGIGFGKSHEQNLAAIRALPRLKAEFGCATLLGVSRKSFLGVITDRLVTERLPATIAADCFGLMLGADIIRVHDVAAHRDAARVIAALAPRPS